MTTPQILKTAAASAAAIVSAATLWFAGAGTALAPEPARLTQPLTGPNSVAAAYYVNTQTPTSVVRWPGSYTYTVTPPAAGRPCSPVDLSAWQDTPRVIRRSGNYAKCM